MAQKDALNQDMFLIGAHSPIRRQLAFRYCQITKRECEYVCLTSDTSESDLKARRELRRVPGATSLSVLWEDQAVVRAALEGRILIIEGFEKAERNVLPVLNNLLENREMQLEDGRFLVAPKRYDDLIAQGQLTKGSNGLSREIGTDLTERLVRVSEKFRVIAVGVPAPPFPGNPLDPPLRSRFQGRHVGRAPTKDLLYSLRERAPTVPMSKINRLVSMYEAIHGLGESQGTSSGAEQRSMAFSSLCYPCEDSILRVGDLLEKVPSVTVKDALSRIFPAARGSGLLEGEAQLLVQSVLESGGGGGGGGGKGKILVRVDSGSVAVAAENVEENERRRSVMLHFEGTNTPVPVMGGPFPPQFPLDNGRLLPHQASVLSGMLQSASIGVDVCLIGAREWW